MGISQRPNGVTECRAGFGRIEGALWGSNRYCGGDRGGWSNGCQRSDVDSGAGRECDCCAGEEAPACRINRRVCGVAC